MASAKYNAWVAGVVRGGGRVVQAATATINPNTGTKLPPSVLSAAYPASVWVKNVNTVNPLNGVHIWPLPDEYSANGQTAYYHAPADLQNELATASVASDAEGKKAGNQLMDQWGVPDFLRSPGKFLANVGSTSVLALAIAFGIFLVVNRRRS